MSAKTRGDHNYLLQTESVLCNDGGHTPKQVRKKTAAMKRRGSIEGVS